ncbi:MAG: ribosome biogenesis GTPase Der, partial [Cyclobacteriaceae bacterium]
ILIMVNKWDLIEKDHKTHDDYKKEVLEKTTPFTFIPIMFTSVINKKRINQVLELTVDIYKERQKKVSTSKLNEAILPEIEKYPPPAVKGKYIKIKYITQLPTKTPTFAFFCNLPQYIKSAYERYLENKIRQHFGFEGVPIKLVFRKK